MNNTLSVDEIVSDIVGAFKLQTPEIFGPAGFAKDFSSNTAVLGDKVTARIEHVPQVADYDPTPGRGFYNGAQDVTSLVEDVPVTLNKITHVPVRISFLTGLRTKGVELYKAAVANIGFALGKSVIDDVLSQSLNGCLSNQLGIAPTVANLDAWDATIREQANAQKLTDKSRWAFVSTELASALGADDRVRSSLFYGQKNGNEGYRVFNNVAGFAWIREYDDITKHGVNVGGVVGDNRMAALAVRKIRDMQNVAKQLGVPEVMKFYPMRDAESGLEVTGVAWQAPGTGDLYVTAAILYGVGVGNQGGPAGSLTDQAGFILRTAF